MKGLLCGCIDARREAGKDGVRQLATDAKRYEEARLAQVEAHITGTVWKIECSVGDEIEEGEVVAILESMKMEMPVEAEDSGVVVKILCQEGDAVNEGDPLVLLE